VTIAAGPAGLPYLVADCRTVAEVAQLVDLATMVPEQRH